MASTLEVIVSPHRQKLGPISLDRHSLTCSLKFLKVSKQNKLVLTILTVGTSGTDMVSLVVLLLDYVQSPYNLR